MEGMARTSYDPWRPLLNAGREDERLVREAYEGARPARTAPIPDGLHPKLREALARRGIHELYAHQAAAAALPAGQPFVVTTGTASGKSLAFQLPAIDALLREPRARALFLYPTKALAQDQARSLASFGLPRELRVAIYDGDTPREARKDVRRNANVVLTNPDMLHVGILPRPDLWGEFLAHLRVVVIDESHVYRGVFGSHVANVLRRLRRLTERQRGTSVREFERALAAGRGRTGGRARRPSSAALAGSGDARAGSAVGSAGNLGTAVGTGGPGTASASESGGAADPDDGGTPDRRGRIGPRFMLASATIANPVEHVQALTGIDAIALIDEDGSPGGERQIAIWNPPLLDEDDDAHLVAARTRAGGGASGGPVRGLADGRPGEAGVGRGGAEHGEDEERIDRRSASRGPDGGHATAAADVLDDASAVPVLNPDVELLDAAEIVVGTTRRSALTEAAFMLADLVEAEVRTICFIRSRKGVEVVAQATIEELQRRDRDDLARTVIGYRAGYTSGQRHELERRLVAGQVRAVVTTTALELGIDIGELDACVVVTFPGTVASLRQMWGRAGRRGRGLAVYVAGEDALNQYFCRHPDEFLDRPVEAAILHHENEPIHRAHLLCAAHEAPLTAADAPILGPRWRGYAEQLADEGLLRERAGTFRPALGDGFPAGELALRSASSRRVVIVDGETGEEIGHVEQDKAPSTVHPGAVYLHLGQEYEVIDLSLEAGYAVVEPFHGSWWTEPKREIEVLFDEILEARQVDTAAGPMPLAFGRVTVIDTVLGYQRRKKGSGEVIDLQTVDVPSVSYVTEAVWYEPGELIHGGGPLGARLGGTRPAGDGSADGADALLPFPTEHVLGALHAAEHGQIAVLPLLAMCDRWDVGGLSTNLHPQTGGPAIIVYEGHVGGVGIARQAFVEFERWVDDARRMIDECPCDAGCPSCVQSPKCGNLNEPLHKAGALELLERIAG